MSHELLSRGTLRTLRPLIAEMQSGPRDAMVAILCDPALAPWEWARYSDALHLGEKLYDNLEGRYELMQPPEFEVPHG